MEMHNHLCRNDENDTQRPAYATDTSIIKPGAPGEGCPRCGGAVFAAEQMLARGSVMILAWLLI